MASIQGLMRLRKSKDQETPWEINLTVDFNGVSNGQLLEWAFKDRKIAYQKVLRDLPNEALDRMVLEGVTVHADDCSKKPQTIEEAVADVKRLSPDKRQAILEALMADD